MDILLAAVESQEIIAPTLGAPAHSVAPVSGAAAVPSAAAAPMEAASTAGSKRESKGTRAPKRAMTKEERVAEATKRRIRRASLKERRESAAVDERIIQAQELALQLVKEERAGAVAPPATSLSSVSSQMPPHLAPATPSAGPHAHAASRFASGASTPVQYPGATSIDLNNTPKSWDSGPAAAGKTRVVPEGNMPVPRTLFGEMTHGGPTLDDADYWAGRQDGDLQEMIREGRAIGVYDGDQAGVTAISRTKKQLTMAKLR